MPRLPPGHCGLRRRDRLPVGWLAACIPRREAFLRPRFRRVSLYFRFLGGLLAIGAGARARQGGPYRQMGASLAHLVGRYLAEAGRTTGVDCGRAGAGWARRSTRRRRSPRSSSRNWCSQRRIFAAVGDRHRIGVARLLSAIRRTSMSVGSATATPKTRPLSPASGALAGLLAVAYNRLLIATPARPRVG